MVILDPMLSTEKRDAKSLIVEILSKKWPLTAKQVFNELCKIDKSGLTYQAVHKALGHLDSQGIVEKKGPAYLLNKIWIQSAKDFISSTEQKYFGNNFPHFNDIRVGENVSFISPSYMGYCLWVLNELYLDYSKNLKPDKTTISWYHVWPVTSLSEKEYAMMKVVMNPKLRTHYSICGFDSPLDKLFNNFWVKEGKKSVLGVKIQRPFETIVTRDLVIQAYIPSEYKHKLDAVYKTTTSLEKSDFAKLYSLFFQTPVKIKISIFRDASIAEECKNEVFAYFH